MLSRIRRLPLILGTLAAALVVGMLAVAIQLARPQGITCPSISRAQAVQSAVHGVKGYSTSARLMTLGEFEKGDPSIGQGSFPRDTLVWVVAYAGRIPNWSQGPPGQGPKPSMTWTVVAVDASTAKWMMREGGAAEPWPPFFDKLPDRAWFCPG